MSELIGKVVEDLALALKRNDQLEAELGETKSSCLAWESKALKYQNQVNFTAEEANKWRSKTIELTKQLQEAQSYINTLNNQLDEWKPIVDKTTVLELQLETSNKELSKALRQIAEMESHPNVRAAKVQQLKEQAKLIGEEMKRMRT